MGRTSRAIPLTHLFSLVRASAAWATHASFEGYIRWGVQAQVRREDFQPEASHRAVRQDRDRGRGARISPGAAPTSSLLAGSFGFAREEDVDLGVTVRLGLLVAPKAFGYDRDGVGPSLLARAGARVPGGFGYLEALLNGLYDSGGSRQRHRAGRGHGRAAARAAPGWDSASARAAGSRIRCRATEFDLGLGLGPASLPQPRLHRRPLLSSARPSIGITIVDDFLGQLGLGVAGFVDYGGAWYAGEPRRYGMGCRGGSPIGRQPLHRYRCPAIRSGAPVRQRRPGGGLGLDGREGLCLLASRAAASL